jgi:hypothetical protein
VLAYLGRIQDLNEEPKAYVNTQDLALFNPPTDPLNLHLLGGCHLLPWGEEEERTLSEG